MPLSRLVLVLTPGRGRVDRPLLGVLSPIAEQTPVSCASASCRLTDPSRNVALSHTTGPCWQSSAGLPVASSAQGEDAIIALVSAESGKCLQSVNGSLTQGDAIVQETCNGSVAQQWWVRENTANGTFTDRFELLTNQASHYCIDAYGGATNGTRIVQWACGASPGTSISNEHWKFEVPVGQSGVGDLRSGILGSKYEYTMTTPGFANGDAMVLYFIESGNSQLWYQNEL